MGQEERRETWGLHDYRIGKLEESDEKQWEQLDGHNKWIVEIHSAARVLKWGVPIVLTGFIMVFILLKLGPERLIEWLLR